MPYTTTRISKRQKIDNTKWWQRCGKTSSYKLLVAIPNLGFPSGSMVKKSLIMWKPQESWFWSLDREDPLEEGTATHSSILACRIPWTEEPGGLQSTGSQRVGHDWSNLARTHNYVPTFENCLAVSLKYKYKLTIWYSNSTFRNLKRSKNICLNNGLFTWIIIVVFIIGKIWNNSNVHQIMIR